MMQPIGCPSPRDEGEVAKMHEDADTAAERITADTDEVLRGVRALESSRGLPDEVLRTRICV